MGKAAKYLCEKLGGFMLFVPLFLSALVGMGLYTLIGRLQHHLFLDGFRLIGYAIQRNTFLWANGLAILGFPVGLGLLSHLAGHDWKLSGRWKAVPVLYLAGLVLGTYLLTFSITTMAEAHFTVYSPAAPEGRIYGWADVTEVETGYIRFRDRLNGALYYRVTMDDDRSTDLLGGFFRDDATFRNLEWMDAQIMAHPTEKTVKPGTSTRCQGEDAEMIRRIFSNTAP